MRPSSNTPLDKNRFAKDRKPRKPYDPFSEEFPFPKNLIKGTKRCRSVYNDTTYLVLLGEHNRFFDKKIDNVHFIGIMDRHLFRWIRRDSITFDLHSRIKTD